MRGRRVGGQHRFGCPAGHRRGAAGDRRPGGRDQPVQAIRGQFRRAAVGGEKVQLGGGPLGAAPYAPGSRGGQAGGDPGVRAGGPQGLLAQGLHRVVRRRSEIRVHGAALGRRGLVGQHPAQQRRREPDPLPGHLDHFGGHRLPQLPRRLVPPGPQQQGDRRLGGQRRGQQRPADRGGQHGEPFPRQVPDALRQRRRAPRHAGGDRSRQGQGKERVAAAVLVQAAGRAAGQTAGFEQGGQVVRRQRRHRHLEHRRGAQPGRAGVAGTAFGGGRPDPGAGAAAHRGADQLGRLRIEPLDVVEDEQHRGGTGAVGQQVEQGHAPGRRAGAGRPALTQGRERAARRGGQGGDQALRDLVDEIGDPGVRETPLARGRAQPQHEIAPRRGPGGDRVEQHGPADAGRPVQGHAATGGEPGLDRREQRLPAVQFGHAARLGTGRHLYQ